MFAKNRSRVWLYQFLMKLAVNSFQEIYEFKDGIPVVGLAYHVGQ